MTIRAALVFTFLAAAGCKEKEWKTYTANDDGKFEVLFQGEPKVTTTAAAGITVKMYSVESMTRAYMIGWADMPIPEWESEGRTKSRLFDARDGALAAVKGKSNGTTKTITFMERFPGIEFGGTSDNKHIRARAILVGRRLYQVIVVGGSPDILTSEEAETFFASFKVIEPEGLLPPGSPIAESLKPKLHEIESTHGRFVAGFPAKPKKITKKFGSDEFTGYEIDANGGTCRVLYADLKIAGGESPEKVRERIDAARAAVVAEAGATLTEEKDATIGSGLPGRSFTATAGDKQLRGKVFLVGARLYQITAIGTEAFFKVKETPAFLDSFRLK